MVGWHHRLEGCELGKPLGDDEGQGGRPGVLQSVGSQRVGHNLSTKQQQRISDTGSLYLLGKS